VLALGWSLRSLKLFAALISVFSLITCRAPADAAVTPEPSAASPRAASLEGLDAVIIEGTRVPYRGQDVSGGNGGGEVRVGTTGRCRDFHGVSATNYGPTASKIALVAVEYGPPQNVEIRTSLGFSVQGTWLQVPQPKVGLLFSTAPTAWPPEELRAALHNGDVMFLSVGSLPPGAWVELRYEFGSPKPCAPEGNR
jgi:hypothetical protein